MFAAPRNRRFSLEVCSKVGGLVPCVAIRWAAAPSYASGMDYTKWISPLARWRNSGSTRPRGLAIEHEAPNAANVAKRHLT